MIKTIHLILLLLVGLLPAWGQQHDDNGDPRGREKVRAAHAAYITERLALTPEEAERFWPLYREYNEKRRAIRQELRQMRGTQANDQVLLDRNLELKQKELDLEKEYSRRFQQIIPAEKLVKLPAAEADFRRLVFRQLQQRHRRN